MIAGLRALETGRGAGMIPVNITGVQKEATASPHIRQICSDLSLLIKSSQGAAAAIKSFPSRTYQRLLAVPKRSASL